MTILQLVPYCQVVLIIFLLIESGIVTSILRFIEFYKTNMYSDLTYLGVYIMIYTEAEACAYFICSCLPGTRPLVRALYHKSGLSSALRSLYRKDASAASKHIYSEITPLGNLNPRSRHTAKSSAGCAKPHNFEVDGSGFSSSEESFHVSHSPDRNVREAYDAV